MALRDRSSFTSADATAGIWRRLARPFVLTEVVDVLMGLRPEVVEAFGAVKVCSSDRAGALLAAMPALSRSLATSVGSQAIRSRGEVRGPVLWSETMSARASSFGDEDLFVCAAPQREYDTPANRALVQALRTLAGAIVALDRAPVAWRDDPRVVQARQLARNARTWADHPSLSRVGLERVGPRDLKRVRGGKSGARYAPALALLEVAAEPLGPADLVALCDRRTRLQHWVLLAIIHELENRGLKLPPLRVEGAALLAGPVTYVHARHRMGEERLHGILLGQVLIDVAHPAAPLSAGEGPEDELARRAGGRELAVIRSYKDVRDAVDRAVRTARELVSVAGDASRPG
jgi:hypothetical protein